MTLLVAVPTGIAAAIAYGGSTAVQHSAAHTCTGDGNRSTETGGGLDKSTEAKGDEQRLKPPVHWQTRWRTIQVVVLTCRPDDYLSDGAGPLSAAHVIDLEPVMKRGRPLHQGD